jgi:type I restriction enzyme S subunit
MELRPDYKQTEVGVIPAEWQVKKFSEITNVITCGLAATPHYVNESVGKPFLSAQNVSDGKVVYSKYKFISSDLFYQITKHNKPERGDLLYTRVGAGIGEAGVIEDDFCFGIYVSLTLIKVNPRWLNSYFLLYVLNSPRYRFLAKNTQFSGGGVQNLNVHVVREFLIPVPSIAEQRTIAGVLSDTDVLIGALDQFIAKKRDLRQAVMQQLLTGHQRLSGFHGKWEVKRLGEIIVRLKKTNRPASAGKTEGVYPFFTNSTKPTGKFLDEADFDTEAIVANTGGEAFFNYYKGTFAAMADCFVFETQIVTRFLYYFLKSAEQFINDNGFTGSGIKHLDKKFFSRIELRIPVEQSEQVAIAAVLSDMDEELTALEQRRDKTRALKQGMMQELLTGRTRLV